MKNEEFFLGELTLLEKLPVIKAFTCSGNRKTISKAKYRCFCGNEFITLIQSVKKGNTKSCGCYQKYKAIECNKSHGESASRLYNTWAKIKNRCDNPKDQSYSSYGGRGIKFYEKWYIFENFLKWSLENGYHEKLTIDRIDNDKGYFPTNCRWVDQKIQNINKTPKKNKNGYPGIQKIGNKYRTSISRNGKKFHVGLFDTKEEAYEIYKKEKQIRDKKYLEEFNQQNKNKKYEKFNGFPKRTRKRK